MPVKKNPKVGQIVYRGNVKNLRALEVVQVGRKYFHTKLPGYSSQTQWHLGSWKQVTQYGAPDVLWESEKECFDSAEILELCSSISKFFQYGGNPNLSIEELRSIIWLIQSKNNPEQTLEPQEGKPV